MCRHYFLVDLKARVEALLPDIQVSLYTKYEMFMEESMHVKILAHPVVYKYCKPHYRNNPSDININAYER